MKVNKISRFIKAIAAVLAVAGIMMSPEQIEQITAGAGAVYGVVSLIQGSLGD